MRLASWSWGGSEHVGTISADGREATPLACPDASLGALPLIQALARGDNLPPPSGARLQHLAHDDCLDLVCAEPAGGQGRLDRMGPEFDGGEARQLPVETTLRGARTGQDDNVAVVCGVAHGLSLPV